MEGGGMSANEILENKGVRLLYFAVLLVLLVLVVWHLKTMNDRADKQSKEHVTGSSMDKTYAGAYGYTSRFGQLKSQPGEGEPSFAYNIDLKDMAGANDNTTVAREVAKEVVKQVEAEAKKERLSSMREYPVFWDYAKDEDSTASASQFVCADGSAPAVGYNVQTGQYNLRCADGSNPGFGNRGVERMDAVRNVQDVQTALLGSML